MQPVRLAIITRRFWPYCGPSETSVAEVAEAIAKTGQHVEILTIRWEKAWPSSFRFRELEVTRIGRLVGGPWGMFRYLRRLHRHVKDARLDGLIVFGLTNESWAVIRNFAQILPVSIHVDGLDLSGIHRRPLNNRQLAILKYVKQILVDSDATAQHLIQQRGISAELISIVPPGVRVDPNFQRSLARQSAARSGLSDAHPILDIKPAQPLVVCASPQFGDAGMLDLIDAWLHVLDRFPFARLWILGDGFKAREIWERICDLNLANSIIMPGFFDELDEVLLASDVYVHPLQNDVSCHALVRALVTGTCTIATSNSGALSLITHNQDGLIAPAKNPIALAESIVYAIGNSDLRDRLGRAARKRASARFDVDHWTGNYLNPFLPTPTPTPTPTR